MKTQINTAVGLWLITQMLSNVNNYENTKQVKPADVSLSKEKMN